MLQCIKFVGYDTSNSSFLPFSRFGRLALEQLEDFWAVWMPAI